MITYDIYINNQLKFQTEGLKGRLQSYLKKDKEIEDCYTLWSSIGFKKENLKLGDEITFQIQQVREEDKE